MKYISAFTATGIVLVTGSIYISTTGIGKKDQPELDFGRLVNSSLAPEYGPTIPLGEGRVFPDGWGIEAIRRHIRSLESSGHLETAGTNILHQGWIDGVFRLTDSGKSFLEQRKGLNDGRTFRFPIASRRVDPIGFLNYEPELNRLLFTYTLEPTSAESSLWKRPTETFKGCALFRDDKVLQRVIVAGVWGAETGNAVWNPIPWVAENAEHQKGALRGLQITSKECDQRS